MPSVVRQLPAQLNLETSAGQPFAITVACTGATVTAGTVELFTSPGVPTVAVTPTVSTNASTITVSFSAADIDELYELGTNWRSKILWKVAGAVDGGGPFNLVAGSLTIFSESQPGTGTTADVDLAITVNGADVVLDVTLGGASPDLSGYLTTAAAASTYLTQLAAAAGFQPLDSDLTAIAAIASTSYGRAFLALANQAALVALLPSYQPLDSDLTALAAANNSATLAATTASFTTALSTKLSGIETGAEVNDTAAEILAKIVTVDGPGSGLNADLLDGISATGFIQIADAVELPLAVEDIDATGTPSASTYLRGDGAWATVSGTGTGIDGGEPDTIYGGTSPIDGGIP